MLLTTCTNCAAQFKVLPEHLNVRQGRVMCGRCRTVFNAFETLKRVEDEHPVVPSFFAGGSVTTSLPGISAYAQPMPPVTTAPSYTVPPELNISLRVTSAETDDERKADRSRSLEVFTDKETPAETTRNEFKFIEPESALPSLELGSVSSTPEVADEFALTDEDADPDTLLPESNLSKQAGLREAALSAPDLREFSAAALVASPLEAPLEFIADPITEPPLMSTDPPSDFGAFGYRKDHESEHPGRWLALCVVMFLTLGVQSIYYFRSAIAETYPQLRPMLASACQPVGCSLSWARDAAAIEVKGSELIELPSKPGRMVASATLINRGKVTQDYPSIELRLTSNTNQTVMSRILQPSDYLAAAVAKDQGIVPNAEVALSLNIEVPPKTAASGYEFLPFYR